MSRHPLTAIFASRVRDFMRRDIMTVPPDAAAGHVIADMVAAGRTSALIVDADGRLSAILTERDVTRRAALRDVAALPVIRLASAPVRSIGAGEHLYRAIATMRRHDLRHMPVVDDHGRPVGMVNLIDALVAAAGPVVDQIDRLSPDGTPDGLAAVKRAQADTARDLLAAGLAAPEILALISDINRELHRQALDAALHAMAGDGWGAPPVPFTVLVMGSGGRGESMLTPDQDNGFILGDYPDDQHTRIDAWFVALAERFNVDLDRIGFPLCAGHVMARNPVWRKSAAQWHEQFVLWAQRRSPVAILFADIFLDFVAVAGPPEPAAALRRHVGAVLAANPVMLALMGADETRASVALGMFGRLLPEPGATGRTDLKLHGLMPLVAAVRLWALKEKIAATATLDRLAALRDRGVVDGDRHDALVHAFGRVTHHLLQQQVDDAAAGRLPGTRVDLRGLRRRERDELRHGLRAIEQFRKETRAAFGGGVF